MDHTFSAEVVLDHVCELGEGPLWDAENNKIFWLDIKQGKIHSLKLDTNEHRFFEAGEMVGCIAPAERGGFISGLENGIGFIDIEKKLVEHIVNPEEGLNNRFNDGKCDAAGRFWVGSMSLEEKEGEGNLYVMETDLSVKKEIEKVSISNGLAWNADGTTMYYINTPTNYIFAFDYDLNTGSIANQRVVIDLTHENGHADGMTIDSEGKLWIAFYGGWRVDRYDPATGELLQTVEVPVANTTCCTFGGSDLTDLFITTASQGMSDEDLEKQPHAGKLFVVKNCGVKGTAAHKFKG